MRFGNVLAGGVPAALLIVALGTAAHAAPVIFFGEDLGLGEDTPLPAWSNAAAAQTSFFSNLIDIGTEDFEGFSTGAGAPLSVLFAGNGTTATLQGNGFIDSVPHGQTNGYGRYATSGTKYWESSDIFAIDFDQPIAAFGFYGIDIGDFNGTVELELSNGGAQVLQVPHTINGPGGSVIYFGFYDMENTYTRIEFGNSAPGVDFFAFDDFSIGLREQINPVPEPGSMVLLAAGLLGVGIVSMRRRRKA